MPEEIKEDAAGLKCDTRMVWCRCPKKLRKMQRNSKHSTPMFGVDALGNEGVCGSQAKLARTVAVLIPLGMRVDAAVKNIKK